MAIPAHTSKVTAGFGLRKEANDSRFAYCKISLFYHIKEKGYHINETLWNRTHALADPNSYKKSHNYTCTDNHPKQESLSDIYPHQLLNLQNAVLTEFAGPFPIARVNFFKVYMSCLQIVFIISDSTHEGEKREGHCLCFLDALLQAADHYKANEHRTRVFGYKQLVDTCKEAMITVLGESIVDDFLWKTF